MRRVTLLLIAVLCIVTRASILVAQSPPLTPFRGLIDHVSADQWGGVPYASAELWHHAISGDGRYVVFNTPADLLANDNDYNGMDDIFLRDRSIGTTTRVSMASDGGPGDGISQYGTISANGRYAAFASGSSNLVPGDTNNHWDVFVRDLDQQTTVRVSLATGGTQGDRDSYYPSLSADGRFVAFLSWATTFAPDVWSSAPRQAYLHDRDADADGIFDEAGEVTTELISAGLSGEIADSSIDTPRVSSDGRVLFESAAYNLSDVGNNGQNHLYLRNRSTGQTELIDRAVTGGPSSWGVYYGTSDMSEDGRFITFSSISPDIVWFDMNWQSQVFLYDTIAGPTSTQIVSRLPEGTLSNGSSYATSVSGDGRYVVFTTAATNLASPPPGVSGPAMLAVRDMLDGSFARVDVLDNGDAFDESDYYMTPAVSADGTAIVLSSRSNNALGGIYGFGQTHVFVLTAFAASPLSASYPMAGGSGSIAVDTSAVTGWSASTNDSWIVVLDGSFGPGPRTVQYQVSDNPSGIARNGSIRAGSKLIAIHQEGDGDPTPPVITPIVTGTQVNGWYTSDITVSFEVSDPDSEIVSQSYNCTETLTFTTDFLYAAPQCEAISHGGTATVTVPLRRDTTPPVINVLEPKPAIYPFGAIVYPSYSCSDAYSGSTSCTGPNMSTPIDTWTRGRNVFTVTSTDEVGNTATKNVEYVIGTDQCISPPAAPANLTHWFMFDGNRVDSIAGFATSGMPLYGTFQPGIVREGWFNDQPWAYVYGWLPSEALAGPSGLTVAMWVKPQGWFFGPYSFPDYQTLVFNPSQYQVVRWNDGTLRWAFNTTTGFNFVNTGVQLSSGAWYHIAVTYNNGVVQTFLNGSLVHSQALSGTLTTGAYTGLVQIGGQSNGMIWNRSLKGMLDDVMIFDTALPASDLENLALSGSGGLCASFESNVTVTAPATVPFPANFMVRARLTDGLGRPLQNRPLTVTSTTTPGYASENLLTDEDGSIWAVLPTSADAPIGEHPDGITVSFAGDGAFAPVDGHASITVLPATPYINWSPAGIGYGTPLGPSQLNAVAQWEGVDIPGTAVYSPPAGTVLDAGTHTLSVTYTPDDPHYAPITAQALQYVGKGAVHMGFTNLLHIYNGQPQTGTITVTGNNGEPLTPFTVTYNGSSSAPVNAGTYSLQVQFAGNDNYIPATSTVGFIITKATPTVSATGGTFTYDAQPHAGGGAAIGAAGETLTPITLTYNGASSTAPTNAGSHTVRASYAGSQNYNAAQSADVALTINRLLPTVDFDTTTVWYTGYPRTPILFVRGAGGVELNPYTVRYNGSTTAPTNAGTYALEVQYAGSANYLPVTANSSFVISKNLPIFPTLNDFGVTYDGQPHGVNVTVIGVQNEQLTPVIKTYNGSTVAPINAGVYTVVVRYDGSANYEADSRTFTMTIGKATPSLTWGIPSSLTYGASLGAGQLNATANVAGTFAYAPSAGTILNAGSHTLTATFTPADTTNYEVTSATRSVTVNKANPQLTWYRPADVAYGMALGAPQLNATANTAGTFVYTPAAGTVLAAGDHTLSVTFTPDNAANYNGGSALVPFTVLKAATTVTWPDPAGIVYGTALGAAQLNATANVAGTFTYSPAAGAVLNAGSQTLSVTFTPDDAANYNGSSANVLLQVGKAESTVSWSNPDGIVYGTALGAAQLNATANVAGTFTYSPAAGAVLNAGSQTLSVTFTPDDAANYAGSSANVSLQVSKAASMVTWSNPPGIVYGTALGAAQLNATASVDGTFSYSPASGTVLNAGVRALSVTFSPADAANYNGSSADVSLQVSKATATVSWSNPAGIVYGTALSGMQLNASANVAGSFAYSPAAGTVLNAGTQQLTVTFAPDDATNYSSATASVSIVVAKATPIVSWSNPAGITYGTALSGTQLNASANVAGSFAYSPAPGTVLNAGAQQLSVTFTPTDSANYTSATASTAISVTPAALTVQTNNATKVYGAALPAFTASGAGFVNGDSMASLAGTLTFTTSATATSAPGSYAVTPGGGS